jgi:hypothetical protein
LITAERIDDNGGGQMNRQFNWSSILLWAIYLALLAVLLPHTAWALFGHFESPAAGWLGIRWGIFTAWAAAFAFEAAIAALTHKLAKRIETTPQYTSGNVFMRRLTFQYLNSFGAGLFVALVVSALANFGHAVEFVQDFAIFALYNVSPLVYSLAFGGILPLVSLLFARILADKVEQESGSNPELSQAKLTIKRLKEELRIVEERASLSEERAVDAERRFNAAGDLVARLFAEEKRQRISAVVELFGVQIPALDEGVG